MTLQEELLNIKRKQNISWNIAKDKVKENPSLDLLTVFHNSNDELNNKALSVLKSFPSRCSYL